MSLAQPDRRHTYFLFQGLLASVLLLIFLYQYRGTAGWTFRLATLSALLGASLAALKFAPAGSFSRWWAQMALFLFDAGIISVTLIWTQSQSDFFLLYVLILIELHLPALRPAADRGLFRWPPCRGSRSAWRGSILRFCRC